MAPMAQIPAIARASRAPRKICVPRCMVTHSTAPSDADESGDEESVRSHVALRGTRQIRARFGMKVVTLTRKDFLWAGTKPWSEGLTRRADDSSSVSLSE